GRTVTAVLISTATFEKHLDWLASRFRLVSLEELGLHLQSGRRFSKPAAAITFDDGYADVYRNAFPILKKKGIPGAVFVVTSLVGTTRLQVCDRLYALLAQRQSTTETPRSKAQRALRALGRN